MLVVKCMTLGCQWTYWPSSICCELAAPWDQHRTCFLYNLDTWFYSLKMILPNRLSPLDTTPIGGGLWDDQGSHGLSKSIRSIVMNWATDLQEDLQRRTCVVGYEGWMQQCTSLSISPIDWLIFLYQHLYLKINRSNSKPVETLDICDLSLLILALTLDNVNLLDIVFSFFLDAMYTASNNFLFCFHNPF